MFQIEALTEEKMDARKRVKNGKSKNNVSNLHVAALMWMNHGENHDPAIS